MNYIEIASYAAVAVGAGGLASKILPPLLTACSVFIEEGLATLTKFFFVVKKMNEVGAQIVIFQYLNHKTRGYGNIEDLYDLRVDHIRPLGRKQPYFIRFTWTTWRIWFLNRVPILLIPSSDRPSFTFLRGTVNWNKLVLDACDWDHERSVRRDEERKDVRFKIVHMRGDSGSNEIPAATPVDETGPKLSKVEPHGSYEPIGWGLEDIGEDIAENPTDNLAMNEHMREAVRQVEFWKDHEQWYKDREIPWKMGMLLYGEPGTGKTSLVRAMAMKFDMPVYSFDLSTMDSREFIKFWGKTRSDKTRIILLEDIDTVFHKRQNAIKGHKLSFDVMLNVLDGIERDDGQLVVVTTNKIDQVDDALGRPNADGNSTRPGRIDLTFDIGKLDYVGRLKIATRILKDDIMAEKVALEFINDTPVIFRERCRKMAVDMLWKDKQALVTAA